MNKWLMPQCSDKHWGTKYYAVNLYTAMSNNIDMTTEISDVQHSVYVHNAMHLNAQHSANHIHGTFGIYLPERFWTLPHIHINRRRMTDRITHRAPRTHPLWTWDVQICFCWTHVSAPWKWLWKLSVYISGGTTSYISLHVCHWIEY